MQANPLRHVAIIMDGNSRWAAQRGLSAAQGHKAGVEQIREVMRACQQHGVQVLTVFAFSSENWQRPRREVEALMSLFLSYLKREARKLVEERVKLRVIGRRDRFSDSIRKAIADAESIASAGDSTLVIAADYGGQWDIANAARSLADRVARGEISASSIDEQALSREVTLADLPPPDMLIRTGGDHRISNFLLWQAAYTELYFCETFWPDFGADALREAVQDYQQRQRRFGRRVEPERGETNA